MLDAPAYLTGIELPTETVLKHQGAPHGGAGGSGRLDQIREISKRAMNAWHAAMALVPPTDPRLDGLRARAKRRSVAGAQLGVS